MLSIADSLIHALQCFNTGDLPRAEAIYRQVLAVDATQAEAWNQLGLIASQFGRVEAAIASLEQAARLAPKLPQVYVNLAVVYLGQKNAPAAIAYLRRALELDPNLADAWFNLGNVFQLQNNLDQAIASYEQALRLQPNSSRTLSNLGWSLQFRGDLPQAIAYYQRAIAIQPNLAEAYYNLATAQAGNDQFDEAVANYQRASQLKPDFMQAFNNLANARQQQGFLPEAIAAFAEAVRISPQLPVPRSNYLFALNYDPDLSPETLLAEHRQFAQIFEPRDLPPPVYRNSSDPHRPLKVGYASPDFYNHPVAYFIEPIIRNHDRVLIQSFLYSEAQQPDDVSARLRSFAANWLDTRELSDEQLADHIRSDGIDILVDLAGHSAYHRLLVFTQKLAPVQITYLGYPNTTGLTTIAYRLADSVTDPPDLPSHYSEQLIRLPHYACFAPPDNASDVAELPALKNGCITFGSLHKLPKVNARVLDLWQRLLEAIPTSRLLVFHHTLHGEARDRLSQEFARRGIASNRIDLRHEKPADGHLGVYREIDISLDAFPWSGHATTCESLWMGVPMLTLYGDRHAARLSASVLTAALFSDWIARTPDEYVAKALQMSWQIDRLVELRRSLRRRVAGSALCDGAAFTRQLEQTYRSLWQTWCNSR